MRMLAGRKERMGERYEKNERKLEKEMERKVVGRGEKERYMELKGEIRKNRRNWRCYY